MADDWFYVLAFDSTSYAIQTEKTLSTSFRLIVIPTPREITHSCGIAIRVAEADYQGILDQVKERGLLTTIYRMSMEKRDGKRYARRVYPDAEAHDDIP